MRERDARQVMYAYDLPLFVSGHDLFSFPSPMKGGDMIAKSEAWMLKCALVALTLAIIATVYP